MYYDLRLSLSILITLRVLCFGTGKSGIHERLTRELEVSMNSDVKLKRVYDRESTEDGSRFLVERLWPRGIGKAAIHYNDWLKDVGPSTELRKWFGHDPEKWDEFCCKYFAELDEKASAWQPIIAAARKGVVTLLYSSHDKEHNNAVALREYLIRKLRKIEKPKHLPALLTQVDKGCS
jgi:uncharacterized protein YeaO (DUF488 family)